MDRKAYHYYLGKFAFIESNEKYSIIAKSGLLADTATCWLAEWGEVFED